MLEKFFKLKENNTTVKTEIMAGITTFMTMAYILAVNPNILSAAGMDANAVLIATALASFVGTVLMALFANYPFALAPGMGLNAYFAFSVVIGMEYSWQIALLAVLVEGYFQCDSYDPKVSGKRRNRFVYCIYRSAECKTDCKQ